MTKPFALLIARPDSPIVASETDSYRYYGNLSAEELISIKLSDTDSGDIDFEQYAGFIVTGSLFDYPIPEKDKTNEQIATEKALCNIIRKAIDTDYPLLGVCYGLHIMGVQLGSSLTDDSSEPLSVSQYHLTSQGKEDPIFAPLSPSFDAVTGHHYSLSSVPADAALLASSAQGDIQALRVGRNVYGTQFHPEIDADGLELRISFYADSYCEGGDEVRAQARGKNLSAAGQIIRCFVDQYRQ